MSVQALPSRPLRGPNRGDLPGRGRDPVGPPDRPALPRVPPRALRRHPARPGSIGLLRGREGGWRWRDHQRRSPVDLLQCQSPPASKPRLIAIPTDSARLVRPITGLNGMAFKWANFRGQANHHFPRHSIRSRCSECGCHPPCSEADALGLVGEDAWAGLGVLRAIGEEIIGWGWDVEDWGTRPFPPPVTPAIGTRTEVRGSVAEAAAKRQQRIAG